GAPLREPLGRRLYVEPLTTAKEVARIHEAEDRVDVRNRGPVASVTVDDGPRIGAGRLRPHARDTGALVDRDDGAARHAERNYVQLRQRVVVAEDLRLILVVAPAFADDADLERRAADIGADDVVRADQVAQRTGAEQPAHRPRLDEADRALTRTHHRLEPPMCLHDEQGPIE